MTTLKRVDIQLSNHAFDLPYIVAKERGFFAEQGLDVRFAEGELRPQVNPEHDPENVSAIKEHSDFERGEICMFRA